MNEDLHDLFEDAVSAVEPRAALDDILARTRVSPLRSRRAWFLGASATVVAAAAAVAIVAALGNNPGTPNTDPGFAGSTGPSPSAGESALASEAASAAASAQAAASQALKHAQQAHLVAIYFVGHTAHGPRLYREFAPPTTGTGPLQRAVDGTSYDPDYGSPWPAGTRAQLSGFLGGSGTIRVDLQSPTGTSLTRRAAGISAHRAHIAVQQLVYTADANMKSTAPVMFFVDGRRATTLLGVQPTDPVSREPAVDVLAQVWIDNPADGATVSSPFKVTGLAAAFEADVVWELRQGSRVVRHGFTTARQCCTMAPYSFTVHAPPGTYTLVVHDTNASGREGAPLWRDTKTVTVR